MEMMGSFETDLKPLEFVFNKSVDRIPPRLRKVFLEVQQHFNSNLEVQQLQKFITKKVHKCM